MRFTSTHTTRFGRDHTTRKQSAGRWSGVAALIFLGSLPLAAQQGSEISGTVAGHDGSVLSGATISLDGGKQGAVSTRRGTFSISNVTAGQHTIRVSYVGYAPYTTTITVSGKTEQLEVVLDERPSASRVVVNASRSPYRAAISSTATKTSTPLIETPANVQIITPRRISEGRIERVDEMFNYMTGVTQGGGTRAQAYVMRGQPVDDRFIPYQVDGISGGVWRQHEPPAALIDRIEYLKGPASTLYGITQLGGVLNYITKKPQATSSAMVELRHSTYASELSPLGARNSANLVADITGPLDTAGRFLYRMIANHINTASYREDVQESSFDVLPELTWNMSDATQLTLSLNAQVDRGSWDEYLPVPSRDLSKLPDLRRRINEPQDYYWDYGWGIGYQLRHSFNENWTLRSVGRHTERIDGRNLFEFNGLKSDGETMKRNYRDQFNERYYTYGDVAVEGRVLTGEIEHTILVGTTVGNERLHFDRRNLQGDSTLDINIYNPVHAGQPLLPAKPGFNRFWNNVFLGGYVQEQAKIIEPLRLVAGVQYISASTDHEERQKELTFEKFDAGICPRVGLVILPIPDLSLFGSYSTSFSPTSAEQENAQGNLDFEPQKGKQMEFGVKFDLFDARFGGTLSAFQLDYENALNATGDLNVNGNTIYVQTGQARSKGVELDIYASPFDGFNLTAGYSYTDSRITADTVVRNVGARRPFVPYNTGNIWASYQFGDGALSGFGLGAGVVHVGTRPTELPTSTGQVFSIPAYTRMDAFLSWTFDRSTIALNINNLLDERYFVSGGVARIVPGQPRTLRTTLQFRL